MRIAPVGLAAIVACGGDALYPDAGRDAAADAPGWTQCSSPSGQAVCGGSNACPAGDGKICGCVPTLSNDHLSVCATSLGFIPEFCPWAQDGKVCVEYGGALDTPGWGPGTGEFDLGLLFLKNGAGDRVRYADFGTFDGAPLPEPATCPTLKNATICGANCGGCPQAQICHGRSPLHPYGFCIPEKKNFCHAGALCASSSDGCFSFDVQPEAQAVADFYGICLPKATCQELASAAYPGGGTCLTQ